MSRKGTYSRRAADDTQAVTFGDPVLDAISSAAGALVIGDRTIDLREGHGSPKTPTGASGVVVFDAPYLKFTGIVNGAERWASDDGEMVEYRVGDGRLNFHAWKKHTFYQYWSMGGEIGISGTNTNFEAADIVSLTYMSVPGHPPCAVYKTGESSAQNNSYVDQYDWGWNAQQPERVAVLCRAQWHQARFREILTAGEGCLDRYRNEEWPQGFPPDWGTIPTHVVDRSAQFGTPAAAAPPTACVIPGLGVHNIAYRDTSGRLHELWRDAQGATGTTNLTANAGAPPAAGNPFAYVDTSRNTEILLFRGGDGTVRSLYWSRGPVGHDDLSGTAGGPRAAGDPVGHYTPAADTHHVIYRTGDGHLHELDWTGVAPVIYGGNLTGAISAPPAAGDPTAFVNAAGINIVVYRSVNGHILSLYWADGPSGLDDLSGVAGTPPAAGDPFAYYTAHNDTHQAVYLGNDGHLWELYWPGVARVVGWDLTPPGAPLATGSLAAYYSAGTNTKHVMYRSGDGRLHEIWWVPGGGTPAHVDLTVAYGAPLAADRPAAFTVEGPNTQHVAYRGTDNDIYELIW